MILSPHGRFIVILVGAHVIKDDKAISLGTAGGTPHKGEYLCARAGVVRRKGGCRRSRCDLLFHRPVDGFGKIIVRLYIGKAGTHGRIIR